MYFDIFRGHMTGYSAKQTDDGTELSFRTPGLDRSEISVSTRGTELIVKLSEHTERFTIEEVNVTAKYKDGVLTVLVPFKHKTRLIKIE